MASKSVHISLTVLLDVKTGVNCWRFNDVTFESRHPIYIRSEGRDFDFFCGRIVKLKASERMCLYFPIDLCKLHEQLPIRSGAHRGRGGGGSPSPWATTFTEIAWATAGY